MFLFPSPIQIGSNDDQTLTGYSYISNLIYGDGGDDVITGGQRSDLLLGGDDDDTIQGLGGADLLSGGDDDDTLDGGAGCDILLGDAGSDILTGGADSDLFVFDARHAGTGVDIVTDFKSGEDEAAFGHVDGAVIDFVQLGGDTQVSIDGTLLAVFENADAADLVDASQFCGTPAEVNIVETDGEIGPDGRLKIVGTNESETLTGADTIENFIVGNWGDDVITGGSRNDEILGNGGNDTIRGGSGDDLISGGSDNDDLYGDAGTDTISGDRGIDTLTGGADGDTFLFNANLGSADSFDHVLDFGSGDRVAVKNFEAGDSYAFVQTGANVDLYINGDLIGSFDDADATSIEATLAFV